MKTTSFEKNGIKTTVTRGDIEVTSIGISAFQKEGTMTATLKQTVETISLYPTKSVNSDLQDNVFGIEDFGFEATPHSNKRTNVVFLDVPEGSTVESVKERLSKFPNATLYRILSNHPILTDKQQYAIDNGIRTKEEFANSQVVKYGEGEHAGELILDQNGKVQYKATFLSTTDKEDVDRRTPEPEDVYMSEEIEMLYNEAILMAV